MTILYIYIQARRFLEWKGEAKRVTISYWFHARVTCVVVCRDDYFWSHKVFWKWCQEELHSLMFSWLFSFRLWLLPSLYLVCCCFFAFLFFVKPVCVAFSLLLWWTRGRVSPASSAAWFLFVVHLICMEMWECVLFKKWPWMWLSLETGHCIQRLVRQPSLSPASVLGRRIRCVMGLLLFASWNRTSCTLGIMVNGFQAHQI